MKAVEVVKVLHDLIRESNKKNEDVELFVGRDKDSPLGGYKEVIEGDVYLDSDGNVKM